MGFALLAGVPPVYGLYSSIFPGWVYYLFGTSRHLSVGAMALTALMVGAVVARIVPGTLCSLLISLPTILWPWLMPSICYVCVCVRAITGTLLPGRVHSGKRSLASVCLSVCDCGVLTVTYKGAACDAASVHFGPTTRRTDILSCRKVMITSFEEGDPNGAGMNCILVGVADTGII